LAKDLPPVPGLNFGDPNGFTRDEQQAAADALRAYFDDPAVRTKYADLGVLDRNGFVEIPSFHPVYRLGEDGVLRTEMVVEVVQERDANFDQEEPGLGSFPMRGGATIIIGKPTLVEIRRQHYETGSYVPFGRIRFVIGKQRDGAIGGFREARQRLQLQRLGLVEGSDPDRFTIDFAMTHGGGGY
jgi:hypothetical protein